MATLQDLTYVIEANTQGLQAAFAPIQKLEKTLNSLAKSVRGLTKTFSDQMNAVAQVQSTGSSNVQKSTNKIVEQLKRQQAALINSTQKLLNLNQTMGKTEGATKAIDANVEALKELDAILKSSAITSADATLARAKFNAVLAESGRAFKEIKEAQSAEASAQKSSDAALLKQNNAIERVRLQYQALANTMEDAGSTPMHFEAATKAFNDFSKAMSSGVLSADEFSEAINKSNASLAMIKRGAGVEKTLTDSVNKAEEALKRQDVRLLQAKQKLDALNKSVMASGASAAIVDSVTAAYNELDSVLKDTATSTADASLAAAKYNDVFKQAEDQLSDYVAAQRNIEKQTKANQAAILKQNNKLADAAIQFENLKKSLGRLGTGAVQIEQLEAAFADFSTQMRSGALDADKFSEEVNKWKKHLADIKRATGTGGGMSQLSDGMRELVQSSQLLLGPLSGVASRIQNLVGLARTGGLAFAAMVGTGLALGFSLFKAVQAGIAFEKQMASINAVLKATKNEAVITGEEVEQVVRGVGDATGTATTELREAAAGLLTMNGMTKELLKNSLLAAQGLAEIGGGSVQTTFRNLMQTLQDPAQAFQTLTQYGVKFDAMQQRTITRLVNQGKHQEAVNKIFEKLNPIIAGATGKANTFAGAWQRVKNVTEEVMVDFVNATGIIPILTDQLNHLATDIQTVANAFGNLIGWLDKFDKSVKGAGQGARDWLAETLGLIDEQGIKERDAARATEESNQARTAAYVKMTRALKAQIKQEEDAIQKAAATLAQWEEQYMSLVRSQEDSADQLKNLHDNWALFEKVLLRAGKSLEYVAAAKAEFEKSIELTDQGKAFVENQKIAINNAKMEVQIAGAQGNAKRELIKEQQIINALYESGAVKEADLAKGLERLALLSPGLAAEIAKLKARFEELNTEISNEAAWLSLTNSLKIAQTHLDNARNSMYGQGLAAALAAKEIELLGRGIEETGEYAEEFAAEMQKVREIFATDFAADMIKSEEELIKQVHLANDAIQASTGSIMEEAKALAVAAKIQEMMTTGAKKNGEWWKEQIRLVNQLVDAQFTLQSNQRIKDLQSEAALQDHIMESLFQSETTRSRLVELAQKELELAQLYGSTQDPRAKKELELFKILQQREALLQHFQELSGAIDNVFSKAEDAIVEFAQTGKIEIEDLVRSIAEDFFRLELRYLILDPLHDLLGKGLGALSGLFGGGGTAAGLLGKGLGGVDQLFKQPLPVVIVGNVDVLGKDGIGKTIAGALGGGGEGATCGCIGEVFKATSSTTAKEVVKAVTSSTKNVADAVSEVQKVTEKSADVIAEASSDIVRDSIDVVQGAVEDVGEVIRKPIADIVPAIKEGLGQFTTVAAKTLGPFQDTLAQWDVASKHLMDSPFITGLESLKGGFDQRMDFGGVPLGDVASMGQFTKMIQPGTFLPEDIDYVLRNRLTSSLLPSAVSQYAGGSFAASGIIGGGDIFGGGAGLLAGDALSSINDTALQLKDTFLGLTDVTGNVTEVIDRSFSEAADSITSFAKEGIDQASSALGDFGTKALTDTAAKAAETTASTVQMGVSSGVTSAQVTQLGVAAQVAATKLSAGSLANSVKGVVGVGSLSHIIPGFSKGGWTGGGLSHDYAGLVHKNEFVFDEEATRNIGLATLEQMRAVAKSGGRGGGQGKAPRQDFDRTQPTTGSISPESFKIINVLDPGIVADYLATREGEQLIMNIMRRNNQQGANR